MTPLPDFDEFLGPREWPEPIPLASRTDTPHRDKRRLTTHITVSEYDTAGEMDDAEMALIAHYRPPLNVIGMPA